jgi:hypothetical protein
MTQKKPLMKIQQTAFLYPVGIALLFFASTSVSAQSCLFQGLNSEARVINRSGIVYTPFPNTLQSDECHKLRVASGQVQVFTLVHEKDSVNVTKTVALANAPLLTDKQFQQSSSQEKILLDLASSALQGGQRLRTGSSRGAGDDMNHLLPRGILAQPTEDLIVEMNENDANVSMIEWHLNGNLVSRSAVQRQQIRLPFQRLTPGSTVDWKLTHQNVVYQGHFKIEPADQMTALMQSLIAQNAHESDQKLATLRIAFALIEKGYIWDAKNWLTQSFAR